MIIIAEVSELTRKIKLPTDRVLSVNGDYQVDGIAFKLPATYEGDLDFSTAAARVHWTGVDKVEHTNLITEEDGNGYPLWVMPSELTQGGHGVIEFAVSFVVTDATAAVTKRWISDPVSFRNRRTVNGSNEDEEAEEETIYDRLAGLVTTLTATAATINDVKEVLSRITNSSPVVVETVADLSGLDTTEHQLAIVRADGYLYCYVGAAWKQGIKYGSYELDATLKESGKAADAKKTGDEISQIKEDLSEQSEQLELVVSKKEPEIVQLVDLSKLNWTANSGGKYSGKLTDYINLKGDGEYYQNPFGVAVNTDGRWKLLYAKFYDAYNNLLTLTNVRNGSTSQYLTMFGSPENNSHFTIENGRTLKYYQGISLTDTYTTEADIAKIMGNADFQHFDNDTTKFGITYGGKSESYVPYNSKGYVFGYSQELTDQISEQIDTKLDDTFNTSSATPENVGQAIIVQSVDANGNATFKYGEAGSRITVPEYNAKSTYPVGSYVMHDGTIYRSNVPITTAEAFDFTHWDAITVSDLIGDMNEKLDMLVTMQEVEAEDDESSDIVQIIDLSKLSWSSGTLGYSASLTEMIPLRGDGEYWQNPCGVSINDGGGWRLYYANFYDAYGNKLTLTREDSGSTSEYLTMFGGTTNSGHFEIENGRTLHHYVGSSSNTYTTTADIAYLGIGSPMFAYFDSTDVQFGITYGGSSASYVPYEGQSEPTYALNYVPAIAAYVEKYMQNRGTAASNNLFNYFYPEADDSTFANLVKYYEERLRRKADDVIRIASFNKYVSRGSSNWGTIKQELADYAVDICGFQECNFSSTSRIETALQGIQFPYGSDHENSDTGKAIVSHWEIASTTVLELLTTGVGVSYALNCKVNLYPYNWYSNCVSNVCTLSVYDYHGIAYNSTIDGTSYTSYQIRMMEIAALLAIIAEDTSDFIVVVGDTNCFESGYDIAAGTHAEWEAFRAAGLTPVLPGYESTCTTDNLDDKYFCKADNNKVYCLAAYDQIFISSNISVEGYEVVDSNLYPVASLSNAPVSDHCMIYADLKFDFDAVMQAKLAEIATTEQWW